jgi:thioredoxin 2
MSGPLHIVCSGCNCTNRLPADRLGDEPKCGRCKQKLFSGAPAELTQATFHKLIRSTDIPVVVDFWAPWCGPCKIMAPDFQEAAGQLEPWVRLAKVNTEKEQGLASEYGIRSIPTLLIFKRGAEVARQTGALDLHRLLRWVQSQI